MEAELTRLFGIANRVLVAEHKGERKGSSLQLRNLKRHQLMLIRSDPPAPEDDACRYDFFAGEKTFRLGGHQTHILSWQSRNEELGQYQGAVRFLLAGIIMAVSGFTGEEDEAAVLWIATKMGWISGPIAYETAQVSSNSRYNDLVQKFNEAERLEAA